MKNIHYGLENSEFKKPSWIESKTICAESGKIANSGCKETYTEYFLLGTAPKECDKHKGTAIKENTTTNSNNSNHKVQNEGIFGDDIYEEKDAFDINRNENKTNTQSNSNQTTNNVGNLTKPNNSNNNNNKNNTSSVKPNTNNTTNKQNTVNNNSNSSNKVNTSNTNKQNTAVNTNSTNTSSNIQNKNELD